MKDSEKIINKLDQVATDTPGTDKSSDVISFVLVESEKQIEEVAELATEIWHEHFVSILTLSQIDYMVEKFQSAPAITNQRKEQGYQYYKIMSNGVMIGYTGMIEEEKENSLFLSKLYIHKDHRGHGYASLAFEFMVELCKKKGYQKIWLTVNRYNEDSIKIYEKKGFVKIRSQVKDIGDGFIMDDFVFEKLIS